MPTVKPKKILIIEDEQFLARVFELKLQNAGFEVKSAYDGQEGMELLEKEKYDLLLLDLILPKLDGFEIMEKMKQKGIKTPVIVLTNLSQPDDEKRARALGAQEFLIKSNVAVAEIVKRVQKFFGH